MTAGAGFVGRVVCGLAAVGEMGGNVRVGSGLGGCSLECPPSAAGGEYGVFTLLLCALPPTLLRQLPGANLLLRVSSSLKGEAARQSAPAILRWLIGSLLFVGLGTQFGHRIWAQPNIFRLLGMGLAASGLAWWMLAGQARTSANGYGNGGWQRMALPTLVMMAAGMVAFQMLSGVGVAIMLLGAWLTMGMALIGAQGSNAETVTAELSPASALSVPSELLRLLLFGTLLLLYRLFQVRYHDDLQNVLLPDHYALLGFIVGAATPAALAQYQGGEEKEKRRKGEKETGKENSFLTPYPLSLIPLMRMLIVGVLLLFVPALLLMLFGTKCLLCLFFGLALATVIGDGSGWERRHEDRELEGFRSVPGEWLIGLFALGMGLAVAQWTAHVLPVTLMARTDKTRLLTYLTGTVALLLFVAGLLNRSRRTSDLLPKGGIR